MMRFASKLYNWVALMIVVGALVGYFFPATGAAMQPVADGFINLIKMLIPPVILCTVVPVSPAPEASRKPEGSVAKPLSISRSSAPSR